jgi:hypothetical protein
MLQPNMWRLGSSEQVAIYSYQMFLALSDLTSGC